jgi:putative ABC transport system ATP-binding protein
VGKMGLIWANHLHKKYTQGKLSTDVLKGITLKIEAGEFVSIVGPSGSGKTTLLYCLSGLEPYTSGSLSLFEREMHSYKSKEIASLRQKRISFVFQFYHLIPSLTVYENVQLATVIAKTEPKLTIEEVLDLVGLRNYMNYYPHQLSGGMQQRVAIARSLINDPDIIFADEPIGNLDQQNGHQIMKIFQSLNQKLRKTILLVTHNEEMISYGTRYLRLVDGKIVEDEQV